MTSGDFPPNGHRWQRVEIVIALYGVGVTGYWLARVLVGERWGMVGLCNNCIPWLAGLGLISSLIASTSRHRLRLIALQLPGLIAFAVLYAGLLWPHDPVDPGDGLRLTAATYNILSSGSDPNRVIEAISALEADVVGLQEVGFDHARHFDQELRAVYPYQALHPSPVGFGLGLLSRYPISEEKVILTYHREKNHLRVVLMRVVLDVNGTPVVVFVSHPVVPFPFKFHTVALPLSRPFLPLTLMLATPYDDTVRDGQIETMRHLVRQASGPVLVLCDCNMSDQSTAYHDLDRLLDDSFREVGQGLGLSATRFLANRRVFPLMARIDYVWHSADFRAYAAFVADDSGSSDHHPVVARLALHAQHAD